MIRGTGSDFKILIADDSPDIANRIIRLLADIDEISVVGPVHNGQDAIELFKRHSPDAALLDMQMPKLNGLQVLTAIRAENSECVVIILTLYENELLRVRCLEAGADHFICKSQAPNRVLEIVKNLLAVES